VELLNNNVIKIEQRLIENYKKRIFIYTEGFHTKDEVEFPRTPVNVVSFFSEPYHEASRGAASEQKGSPLRSIFKLMLKYPSISGSRIWDPVTRSNLVSIRNNQWNQAGMTSD
jgi:hypothetical protein